MNMLRPPRTKEGLRENGEPDLMGCFPDTFIGTGHPVLRLSQLQSVDEVCELATVLCIVDTLDRGYR